MLKKISITIKKQNLYQTYDLKILLLREAHLYSCI